MKKALIHKTLFIGRINLSVTIKDIMNLLSTYGKVNHVTMGKNECREGLQYCFASMSSAAEAQQCVERLNNFVFKGQELSVRY